MMSRSLVRHGIGVGLWLMWLVCVSVSAAETKDVVEGAMPPVSSPQSVWQIGTVGDVLEPGLRIYAVPEDVAYGRTRGRVLPAGTRIRVLDLSDQWIRVMTVDTAPELSGYAVPARVYGEAKIVDSGLPLRVGVQLKAPPMSFVMRGEMTGFDVDIARAVCEVMEYVCELEALPFAELLNSISIGTFQMLVASVTNTPARRQSMDFSQPYYRTPIRFLARRADDLKISPVGLAQKRIGVKRGTTADSYVTALYGVDAYIARYKLDGELYADLIARRLDVIVGDEIKLEETVFMTQEPLKREFGFVGAPVTDPQWVGDGVGIVVKKGNTALLNRINQALSTIMRDGQYDKIRKRYFGKDIL